MKKILAIFLSIIIFTASGLPASALTFSEAAGMDLRTPSGLTAEELRSGLKKDLVDLAEDFIAAEEKYGINAVFLAALAAFESGWGRHCFRENNLFGWGGKSFETKSECVDFVASKLAEHYLSEDGKYYHGMNLYGVNRSYNGSDIWVENVAAIMAKISDAAVLPAEAISDVSEETGTVRIILGPASAKPPAEEPEIQEEETGETENGSEEEKSEKDPAENGYENRVTGGVIVIGAH